MRTFPKILFTLVLVLLQLGLQASGPFPWSGNGKQMKLYIPPSLEGTTLRGIVIHANPTMTDESSYYNDAELVAFAETQGFAVLALGTFGKFSLTGTDYTNFTTGLSAVATASGHLELNHAPWVIEGYSMGGQISYGLNTIAPEKVIAFVANKGDSYNANTASDASRKTPGILFGGETDEPSRRNAIKNLYNLNRVISAPQTVRSRWAWVEEEDLHHVRGLSFHLMRPFFEECIRLRYPENALPSSSSGVTLKELSLNDGWSAEWNSTTTSDDGLTPIYAYTSNTTVSWLPNQRMAYLFRAFSSYNKGAGEPSVTGNATIDPLPTGPNNEGSVLVSGTFPFTLTFSVNMTGKTWHKIELYEGDQLLATRMQADGDQTPEVPVTINHGGYYVFHGLVYKTNAANPPMTTSKILPVYVAGPSSTPTPTPPPYTMLVDLGPSSGNTTTTGWNNFTGMTGNYSISLVDSTGAGTGASLRIANTTVYELFTATNTSGTTASPLYPVNATKDSFYYDKAGDGTFRKPKLKLTGLDPDTVYDFNFFGSRTAGVTPALIRSTKFTVTGANSGNDTNDATDNTGDVATVEGISPNGSGEISISLEKAADNNSSTGVGYLNVIEITAWPSE